MAGSLTAPVLLDMSIADAQTATAIAAVERLAVMPPAGPEAGAMTEVEAYTALGLLPGATWENIEQARRGIVQLSHPDQVSKLPAPKRSKLVAAAARANVASLLLHRLRSQ